MAKPRNHNPRVGGSSPSAGTKEIEHLAKTFRPQKSVRHHRVTRSTTSAIEAADKLRAALEGNPKLTGPVGFTSQNDDEPPPGTP